MLRRARPPGRGFPGQRARRERVPEPAHVPRADGGPGRLRRAKHLGVQRLVMETLPEEHRDPAWFRMAAEGVRLAAVAGVGVLAMAPFLRDAVLGGGDAKWYSTVVADVVEQWRMGFGPAFVGQTRFGAIGTVTPLRLAPYLQHFTVAIDMATGRRLSP